ncbi:MAG: hypothetical protein EOM38_09900 [Bacilli bacterium]|nr:hypothetical protein [Bacilli bacterium]
MIPKFRIAFKNKTIGEVGSIDFVDETVTIPVYDKLDGEYLGDNVYGLNQVTLIQSTGLFDNSMPKKEIFEHDIVEWEHKDTGQLVRGIVKYDTELGFWGMTDARFNDLTAIGYLANQRVTVLGNIYQNKELVEEK